MSSLLGSLLNASTALGAQQTGAAIAGQNLANVNTPGYARQRVNLGNRVIISTSQGDVGTGVEALSVTGLRDSILDTSVTREASQTAFLQSQQNALAQAQTALGENVNLAGNSSSIGDTSQLTSGISSSINSFFNAWSQLSANPSHPGARQVLVQQASTMATQFNSADQQLSNLQGTLTTQINSDTTSANGLLTQIASLNSQIAASEVQAPGSASNLRDQRQSALEQLAQYMNFTTQPTAGHSNEIDVVVAGASGGSFSLVQGPNVQGGLNFTGSGFTSGQPQVALSITGGSLAANLSTRDGAVANLRTSLQSTAQQLATAVNTAYNPGGAATNFFQATPVGGIIALDPTLTATNLRTTTTTNAGANDIALAVGNVATQQFSTAGGDAINGTIGGFYSLTVTGLGATLSGVNANLTNQEAVQQLVMQQRDSVSGVSTDEEMTNLLTYQRAYEASAKVVSTLDSMLNTIVNNLKTTP